MERQLWRLPLFNTRHGGEGELGCEECLKVLDNCGEWILVGVELGRVKMLRSRYLPSCEN